MTSILNPAGHTDAMGSGTAAARALIPAAASARSAQSDLESSYEEEPAEFELVFGRRQIAGSGLIILAAMCLICCVSYLAGRSTAKTAPGPTTAAVPVHEAAAPSATPAAVKANAVVASAAQVQIDIPEQASVPPPPPLASAAKAESLKDDGSPIFAEAAAGATYFQVGVIDRGLAQIWAEGLRSHGLHATVAQGAGPQYWKVLVGPLPSQSVYDQTKLALDKLGISMFTLRGGVQK